MKKMSQDIQCKCALSRYDNKMNNFSCFYDSEIKKIYSILQKVQSLPDQPNVEKMYQILLQKYKCPKTGDTDDCIYTRISREFDSLPKEYKDTLNRIYFSAKPLDDKPPSNQWLDNFIIMEACHQFELNSKQNYKFGGVVLYDDFEYAISDEQNKLNPYLIIRDLKKRSQQTESNEEQPLAEIIQDNVHKKHYTKQRKIKTGFVLNLCHKYSSGMHWVAMGITYFPDSNRIDIDYFDSQGDYGFETQPLKCKFDRECSDNPEICKKYEHYQPRANEWLAYFKKVSKDLGIKQVLFDYNKFYTQHDDYSCGYHAMLFNYLLSRIDEPIQTIYLLVQTEQGKNLDKFIYELRDTMYDDNKQIQGQGKQSEDIGFLRYYSY